MIMFFYNKHFQLAEARTCCVEVDLTLFSILFVSKRALKGARARNERHCRH